MNSDVLQVLQVLLFLHPSGPPPLFFLVRGIGVGPTGCPLCNDRLAALAPPLVPEVKAEKYFLLPSWVFHIVLAPIEFWSICVSAFKTPSLLFCPGIFLSLCLSLTHAVLFAVLFCNALYFDIWRNVTPTYLYKYFCVGSYERNIFISDVDFFLFRDCLHRMLHDDVTGLPVKCLFLGGCLNSNVSFKNIYTIKHAINCCLICWHWKESEAVLHNVNVFPKQNKYWAFSNCNETVLAHLHTMVSDSCVCLFFSPQICFLVSAFRGRMFSDDSCATLALFSHYFHLSQFFWMLIQVTAG